METWLEGEGGGGEEAGGWRHIVATAERGFYLGTKDEVEEI